MMQLIAKMQAANDERNPFMLARSLFIEWVYYGPDVLNYAWSFAPLVERWEATAEAGEIEAALEALKGSTADHFRQYDAEVDAGILAALVAPYMKHIDGRFIPEELLPAASDPAGWATSSSINPFLTTRKRWRNCWPRATKRPLQSSPKTRRTN